MNEFAEIALYNCSYLRAPAAFDSAINYVDDVRKAKITACDNIENQCLSLGAGLLARYLLQRHGLSTKQMYFDDNGKPRIKGETFFISMSHAGDWAMAGLSSKPIAVDVERYQTDQWNIAKHFFTKKEQDALHSDVDATACFWRLWSRKECFIKQYGLQDLRSISVLEDPPDSRFWDFTLPGYSCVACVGKEITPLLSYDCNLY